ncbi:MAG TPA: cupredoxin domain-containing protein [Burkholderiales bacterium]|nr:cupredoxin domain-containing protein [Burkholderiales bacterium]
MTRRRLLSGALAAFLAGAGAWSLAAGPKEKVVKIAARKFTYAPNIVTLKKGVPVVLEFTSGDVVMGFNAPDLNIRADIIPGQTARLRFTPDKAGSFVYLCDIFCGDGHERMTGKIRVVA